MLLGYIWLLGTFVNSSCDIKINVNIVQNCCRNLAVRGLNSALGMKTTFYGLEILRNDRIMTKVYGKLKIKM